MNYDSGTLERFHRDVVVAPFKCDARREFGQLSRLYEVNNERALLDGYRRYRKELLGINDAAAGRIPADKYPMRVFQHPDGELWHYLQHLEISHPPVARCLRSIIVGYYGPAESHWLLSKGEGKVYGKYVIDYGTEKILFINAPRGYRGREPRRDYVEVNLQDEDATPAVVIWYYTDLRKNMKALVKWVRLEPQPHHLLRVRFGKASPPTKKESYMICDVESITGHAHIVPDYDNNQILFWDVVNRV